MTTPTSVLFIVCGSFAATALGAGLLIMSRPASAQQPAEHGSAPKNERMNANQEQTHTAVATVQSIDRDKRTLTLKTDQGKTTTVDVPEDVQSFDRVKKGDKIRMTYRESMAVAVHRPGEARPQNQTKETTERTQGGANPSGTMTRTRTVSAEIVSVDSKKNTVKFKGPKGKIQEMTVEDPDVRERLKDLKPGDVVQIDYTEALAVTLEPSAH